MDDRRVRSSRSKSVFKSSLFEGRAAARENTLLKA
jgi:hypothetical protein